MTGAGNQEDAETVGLGPSIIIVAQPWSELPAQMEGFLDLNFLVVRLDGVQVTECWGPNEQVGQELVGLGWHEEALWTREELGKGVWSSVSNRIT